jgi:hypothetical protein
MRAQCITSRSQLRQTVKMPKQQMQMQMQVLMNDWFAFSAFPKKDNRYTIVRE